MSPVGASTKPFYPYMPIGKVCLYRSLFVCLYEYGFLRRWWSWWRQIMHGGSSESKAGNLHIFVCELCSPEAQNRTNRPERGPRLHSEIYRGYADVGSACVDIHQSPSLNLLVQFHLNNVTTLYLLISHSTTSCPTTWRSHLDRRLLWRHFTLCSLYHATCGWTL